MGGAPPAALGAGPLPCGTCGHPYLYLLTLEPDLLGEVAGGRAYSLLVCDGPCRGRESALGPGLGSTLMGHALGPRGPGTSWQWAKTGRGLVAALPSPDPGPGDGGEPAKVSKIGGKPGYKQDEAPEPAETTFVVQISDDFGVIECEGRSFLLGGSGGWYAFGELVDGALVLGSPRGICQI